MIWDIILRVAVLAMIPLLLITVLFYNLDNGREGVAWKLCVVFLILEIICVGYIVAFGIVQFMTEGWPVIKQFILTGDI